MGAVQPEVRAACVLSIYLLSILSICLSIYLYLICVQCVSPRILYHANLRIGRASEAGCVLAWALAVRKPPVPHDAG
jgi:hypothetical protein